MNLSYNVPYFKDKTVVDYITMKTWRIKMIIITDKLLEIKCDIRISSLYSGGSVAEWLVWVIAWFVVIFGINTTSDISKLLYVISRAVRRVKFETILNITSGIYAKYHIQIMLLFVYTTTRKRFVIFSCRYFKLSWNTTALSQSNCRNFSCSGIRALKLQSGGSEFNLHPNS